MKYLITLLMVLSLGLFACGESNAVKDCKAECLGASRAKTAECGDDQACKQKLIEELEACEAACSN